MKAKTARRFLIGSLIAGTIGLWTIHKLNADRESKRLTTLAAAYLAKNERQNATECLISALSLYPGNTEARRLLLEITPEKTPGENNAAPANPPDTSPQIIVEAPPQPNPNPIIIEAQPAQPAPTPPDPAKVDAHLDQARKFLAANNSKAAEKELRAAVTLDATVNSKSQLANFLLSQPLDPNATEELVSLLRELGRDQTSIGAEALFAGAVRCIVPRAEIESWLTVLRSHPAATTTILLTVDRLDALLHPRTQSTIAENAARRLRSAPLEDRDAGMRWLSSIGEYSLASPLVSLNEALQDRATMESWLVTHSLAGNFDAVLAATAAPNLPVPAYSRKIFHGNALAQSGKSAEGLQMMRDACNETGLTRSELLEALAILGVIRSHPLFEEELTKAISDPDTTAEAVNALSKAVHLSGDAVISRRFYEIAASAPALRGDERVSGTRDHFRLLLNLEVDINELARNSEIARDPAPRIAYILALLNVGQYAKALIETEDRAPTINPVFLTASQQAVIAATLAVNDRMREAFAILALIQQDQLTVQERDWLRGHLDAASKTARSSFDTTSLTARYPWLVRARRIAIDLGALLVLFLTWKTVQRVHLWLRRDAIG